MKRILWIWSLASLVFVSTAVGAPKKLLVVSVTSGFRHGPAIERLHKILPELAARSGAFTVDVVDVDPGEARFKDAGTGKVDEAKVNAAIRVVLGRRMSLTGLGGYDGVIFANTSGEMPIPDVGAFLDWVAKGKAFVGIHAATDSLRSGDPKVPTAFTRVIGAAFRTHGAQATVECINQDPGHPACRDLPERWTVHDEIYLFDNFERGEVRGLLTLDREPNSREAGDYPIAWCKEHGKGRVFYTSLGHREDVIDDEWGTDSERKNSRQVAERYQQHLLGGILWALGVE